MYKNTIICVNNFTNRETNRENVEKIFKEDNVLCLKSYFDERKYDEILPFILIDAIITGIESNAIQCINYIIDLIEHHDNIFCIQLIENAIIKISDMNPTEIKVKFDYNIFNELNKKINELNRKKERFTECFKECLETIIHTYDKMDEDI